MFKNHETARIYAQGQADRMGCDYQIVRNFDNTWSVHMLPAQSERFGRDLDGEVIMCSNLSKCRIGHGPVRS